MSNRSVPAAAEGMSELSNALGGLHLAACQARTFAEMAQHAGKQLTNVREDEAGRFYRLPVDDANELAASLASVVRFATTAETFAPVIGRLAHEASAAGPSMPVSAAETSGEILHSAADKLLSVLTDELSNLIFEARMAAVTADYLAIDALAEHEPGPSGQIASVLAWQADMTLHAINRALVCIKAVEDEFERQSLAVGCAGAMRSLPVSPSPGREARR